MYLKVLIIVFSLFLSGCYTFQKGQKEWILPSKPKKYEVEFVTVDFPDKGLFLNEESSKNLLKNINEVDAYALKLETLIEQMNKYYERK